MKKILIFVLTFVLVWSFKPVSVQAAEFRVAENDGNIVVSEVEKIKNLYAGGNLVSINADVEKGLTVGGNFITIKGNVENNLMAGGGTVTVMGNVGGTAYVGGGNVFIEGEVTDDLFVGGGTVTVAETAKIGGDLIVGGGVVNVYGPVGGNVLIGAGQAIIDSQVDGQIKAEVENLSFGSNARVIGDVVYKSTKEATIDDEASILGEVKFNQISQNDSSSHMFLEDSNPKFILGLISFGLLIKFAVTLITALTLTYIFEKLTIKIVNESLTNFLSNFGLGFATLILTPMIGMILLMTLMGVGVAGLIMSVYLLMLLMASPLASISLGSLIMKLINKSPDYLVNWKSTTIGAFAMCLVAFVPPFGWMISLAFTMISLGTLCRLFYKSIKMKNK